MKFTMFLTVLAISMFQATHAYSLDLRQRLLIVAEKEDPNFPNKIGSQLTHFSHVCELKGERQKIYVVDQRSVLTGMLAPRGNNQISFFDEKQKFIASIKYIGSRPLWCEGERLYLFGGWDGAMPGDYRCASGNDCNVILWNETTGLLKLVHEKKYGSSGGIDDP